LVEARSAGIEALQTVQRREPLLRVVEGEELARDARTIRPAHPRAARPPLFGGVSYGIDGAEGANVFLRDHQSRVA
jgi:hypothetical protein